MSEVSGLQKRIRERREELGFANDALQLQILLTEEVGEVSAELRALFTGEDFAVDRLSDELADVFVYLSALASEFQIDLEEAVQRKFFS